MPRRSSCVGAVDDASRESLSESDGGGEERDCGGSGFGEKTTSCAAAGAAAVTGLGEALLRARELLAMDAALTGFDVAASFLSGLGERETTTTKPKTKIKPVVKGALRETKRRRKSKKKKKKAFKSKRLMRWKAVILENRVKAEYLKKKKTSCSQCTYSGQVAAGLSSPFFFFLL